MDLILRNGRLVGQDGQTTVDIGIQNGHITAIESDLSAEGRELDLRGRLVTPGFIETHIHLDKSCIHRCQSAIVLAQVATKAFTAEDVQQRAARTLGNVYCTVPPICTHLEVDPGIGLRGLDGVLPLIQEYKWALDLEVCVFPQEGLLNNPGTDELLVAALNQGASVIGAAPYTDTDPHGQIDRIFALAREFNVAIDMHLDFGHTSDEMDIEYVCNLTEEFGYGGRVTVGHVTKMSSISPERFFAIAQRLANVGVAVTVLPSTDPDGSSPGSQYHSWRYPGAQTHTARRYLFTLDQ